MERSKVLLRLRALAVTTTGYNYSGADSEMVQWPDDDDGSAAHEPETQANPDPSEVIRVLNASLAVTSMNSAEQRHRLANQQEQIGRLICERDQLQREIEAVRGLLSRLPEEDAAADPVKADIDRTIDHLLQGRTTRDQRKGLSTATERAERVTAGSDAAVGRALR